MKTTYIFVILCFMVSMTACSDSTTTSTTKEATPPNGTAVDAASQVFQKLNVGDFQAKMDELGDEQLIDVRTLEELQETGTLPNAQHVDYQADNFNAIVAALDKNKPVMVYCKSGGRSGDACDILKKLDFKEVYDLEGGITAWMIANMPTENLEE